jgi:hypothetical protein
MTTMRTLRPLALAALTFLSVAPAFAAGCCDQGYTIRPLHIVGAAAALIGLAAAFLVIRRQTRPNA